MALYQDNLKQRGKKMSKDGINIPKEKSKKPEGRGRWFLRLYLSAIFIVFFSYGMGVISVNPFKEPEIKEVTKEVEVIKYVEKSKTPTSDFLTYLNSNLDPNIAEIIGKDVNIYSEKYKLPRKLICAIMRKESNIDATARSSKGAVGLMQIMPNIHKEKVNGRNPYHISTNIEIGCAIFKEYLDKENGDIEKAFHRYLGLKAGEKQVEEYVGDILAFWAKLEMYDYLNTIEREKNREHEEIFGQIDETTNVNR